MRKKEVCTWAEIKNKSGGEGLRRRRGREMVTYLVTCTHDSPAVSMSNNY